MRNRQIDKHADRLDSQTDRQTKRERVPLGDCAKKRPTNFSHRMSVCPEMARVVKSVHNKNVSKATFFLLFISLYDHFCFADFDEGRKKSLSWVLAIVMLRRMQMELRQNRRDTNLLRMLILQAIHSQLYPTLSKNKTKGNQFYKNLHTSYTTFQ